MRMELLAQAAHMVAVMVEVEQEGRVVAMEVSAAQAERQVAGEEEAAEAAALYLVETVEQAQTAQLESIHGR